MLSEIIADLGENYNTSDNAVLQHILEETTTNALFISNRNKTIENIELLKYEIMNCVKSIYLQRGAEDVKSRSQSGLSSTFVSPYEELQLAIIRNGKRIIK